MNHFIDSPENQKEREANTHFSSLNPLGLLMKTTSSFVLFGALVFLASCSPGRTPTDAGPSDAGSEPSDAGVDAPDALPIECVLSDDDEVPNFLQTLGCDGDFQKMASLPLDTSIPGARSAKVVYDRFDNMLYVQNSSRYLIHHEFASANLSGGERPFVADLAQFNAVEYFSPDRRFILAALTKYEGPGIFALEFSPYDTADSDMAATIFNAVQDATPFVDILFHPTSEQVADNAAPANLPTITTGELFEGIDYQPLNLATSLGRLRFVDAADLENTYLDFREIVVLDEVPNDISVVLGIITEQFQTPLSHINVLSQNRGTPNMGLRGARTNAELLALDGKFVRLTVGAFEYSIEEVTQEEADAWFEDNRPDTVQVPDLDLSTNTLVDIQTALNSETVNMRQRIREKIPSLGGKAAHYAELFAIDSVPVPPAFVVPVFFYDQHMRTNDLYSVAETMLADARFETDAAFRDEALRDLRTRIKTAPVDPQLLVDIETKMVELNLNRSRFRSSTNAEDLEGFTGAGLYTSKSGEIGNTEKSIEDAVRKVWASVWFLRAVDERRFRGIAHLDVGMALLAHRSFPDEYANGVALTANPFDPTGLEPAFYINVQRGEASVVKPEPGVTTDQILYQYERPGQPAVFLGRSNSDLLQGDESVLTNTELFTLGTALADIHRHFAEAYGQDASVFYGMDVEFKYDILTPGGEPQLLVKQARPHPGRGQ